MTELGAGLINFRIANDSDVIYAVAPVTSACVILLACFPIYDALRCSGSRKLALILLVPLALISLWQIWGAVHWYLNLPWSGDYTPPMFFFDDFLLPSLTNGQIGGRTLLLALALEAAKWLIFFAIAIWLTVEQARAWRKSAMPDGAS